MGFWEQYQGPDLVLALKSTYNEGLFRKSSSNTSLTSLFPNPVGYVLQMTLS